MPEYRELSLESLEAPKDPWRIHTLMQNIESLCQDIAQNGQLQPICVVDRHNGVYEVVAGHRRAVAMTKLGRPTIKAMVYRPGEADLDAIMASENLHRNKTNDMEDAVAFRRLMTTQGMDEVGISSRFNIPLSRINNLLSVLDGDPRVSNLVAEERISVAQAVAINEFESEAYTLIAMEQATKHKRSANDLRRWRLSLKASGAEAQIDAAVAAGSTPAMIDISEAQQICDIDNHAVPVRLSKRYIICAEHYNLFIRGLEALQREAQNGGN